MTQTKKITVLSPCFNEEGNVETCYDTVNDATLLMLPVDLQDPPELLPEFVGLWEQGYDVVAGARSQREERFILRFFRKAFYRIVNHLSEFEIEPDVGEFQLVDRKVLDAVLQHRDNYPYIRGIVASVGFKRITRHYTWKERKVGTSKHNYYAMIDHALNAIFAFTRAPMRFCTIVGFILSTVCILFSVISVLLYFFDPSIAMVIENELINIEETTAPMPSEKTRML